MNLPNKLTILRVILIPVFVVLLMMCGGEGPLKYAALFVFAAASLTDMLDGKIARARNLVTDFGKFMDPLADKALVCAALICFVELGRLPGWVCIVIVIRDLAISGFRLVASDKGRVIAADMWGKVKTTVQMITIIVMLLNWQWLRIPETVLIYAMTALTVISFIDCFVKNIDIIADGDF